MFPRQSLQRTVNYLEVRLMKTTLLILTAILPAFVTQAQPTLAEALDTAGLTWTTGGNASWLGQTNVTFDGVDAARSGTITDGQESWLQTIVTGPGVVAFWWKVSSEGDSDVLQFYMGGAL